MQKHASISQVIESKNDMREIYIFFEIRLERRRGGTEKGIECLNRFNRSRGYRSWKLKKRRKLGNLDI